MTTICSKRPRNTFVSPQLGPSSTRVMPLPIIHNLRGSILEPKPRRNRALAAQDHEMTVESRESAIAGAVHTALGQVFDINIYVYMSMLNVVS